jgi:peptidoglycan/LPS O-acetylase OafA/YrhL
VAQNKIAQEPGPHRYAFIDALRGYAILMVIAVHTSQFFNDLPPPVRLLADQGARGVQLFFVASALTLCLSWQARGDGAAAFYMRRLFRIAPMFWLAIAYFVWHEGFGPQFYAPDGIGLRHVAMTALFVHGWLPDTITSVVPGGWSVADEVTFYAVFPLLMLFWKRVNLAGAVVFAIAVVVFFGEINDVAINYGVRLPQPERQLWFVLIWLWFPSQAGCFAVGMVLAKVAHRKLPLPAAKLLLALSIAAAITLALYPPSKLQTPYGLAFAGLTLALMNYQPRWLVNSAIAWIGKVSFSAYLIHLAIIPFFPLLTPFAMPTLDYGVMMLIITAATVAISSITYLYIEKPMIRLGERLVEGSRAPRSKQSAVMPASPIVG